MNVYQGKVYNYLGMTLYYTDGGTVKASMLNYTDEIIAVLDKADPRGRVNNTSAAP